MEGNERKKEWKKEKRREEGKKRRRKGKKEKGKNKVNEFKTVIHMVDSNSNIPIITLNVNGLTTPIKRYRMSE